MMDNILNSQAFKLKGRLYTLTVLQLLNADIALFESQLQEIIAKVPRFFDKTPVVLDCSLLEAESVDLQAFYRCLRNHQVLPVGIQGATPYLSALAQCQGLAILNASSTQDKPLFEESKAEASGTAEATRTKLLTAPIRSGQQVVSKGGDLVIVASVSQGAELLADGNIHIYGCLRGRALAGILGDKQARIFCQSLEAELVSIAGYYRLSEAIQPQTGPCQIYLRDEHIHIEPLC